MYRMFNEGDTVKSHLDNKIYTIVEVWGEILKCVNKNEIVELNDFEVDIINKRIKYNV